MSDNLLDGARAPAVPIATLELPGGKPLEAKLVKLTAIGAMIECCRVPDTGTKLVFVHGLVRVPARVTWAGLRRAGLEFEFPVDPGALT